MKTTSTLLTLLLSIGLLLAGCTIQPAVPVTDTTGAGTATEDAATEAATEATAEGTTEATVEATAEATTEAAVEGAAAVTTTTSVMTTTVTTVTEGAVVSETAAVTDTGTATGTTGAAGTDAGLLPTPTPAAADTGTVTGTETVTAAGSLTATTVVTDADAGTILQVISSTPGLETLATALTASGMAAGLDAPGPLTFFAPNNDAFAAIPADQLNALLADPATLAPILQYHIVIDNISTTGLGTLGAALSSSGLPITATLQADGSLLINDATVVQGDIPAANGVIHIIDHVLMPPPAATTP